MKIKTKKTMNLPQLIEWVWDNDVRGQLFPTDQNQEAGIYIATNRDFMMSNADYIKYSNTFTVEVEEEITEDTKISILAHYSIYGFKRTKNCTSINDVKDDNSIAFYIMNHDRTMTLIWTKETGLVE
ncbi:hypothetical protein [Staphylococcus sp. 47.1]|uniref:hypothetical protein n=1 Tax=Staphylococcus sp. 47.1 TaxID=1929484 RepID=UPI000946F58A|nr:hypothetical protein [Staphylococcus sp. 47.1]OLF32235.1 hypothetical protein BSZ11_06805 [Staphylococcus sp. 47.1]